MLLKKILSLKESFETDGRQPLGIRLTPAQAKEIRWELHQLYGFDPGPGLMPLYGMEILATDADSMTLEE
ncbi:MAG: hypothetical protein HQL63_04905 [Magnetococcales bacterium]|nr:hypothetical protein [Magnetococcales bacterium]